MTLLITASAHDAAAHALAERWRAHDVRVLTPADFSRPGWRMYVGAPERSTAVAGARPLAVAGIRAVISRLASVTPADLPWIAAGHRSYVAAEMSAFLLAFLSSLGARVVNRPRPGGLCGPPWPAERWRAAARAAGLPTDEPARRPAGPMQPARPGGTSVTVIGEATPGAGRDAPAAAARRLAASAGVELLVVRLGGCGPDAPFRDAHFWPDVADPAVADALLEVVGR